MGRAPTYRFPYLRLIKPYHISQPYARRGIILDIACGEGHGLPILSRSARLVVGADSSADAVRKAERYRRRGNIVYVVARAENLPFRSGKFSLVTSFQTVEHLSRVNVFLAEVRRILAPKGVFLCSTPHKKLLIPLVNPYHVREYDVKMFRDLIESYFTDTRIAGITSTGRAARLKAMEREMGGRLLAVVPAGILSLLPQRLRVLLYNIAFAAIHRLMSIKEGKGYRGLSLRDFTLEREAGDSSTDLIAVCRK